DGLLAGLETTLDNLVGIDRNVEGLVDNTTGRLNVYELQSGNTWKLSTKYSPELATFTVVAAGSHLGATLTGGGVASGDLSTYRLRTGSLYRPLPFPD